MRPSEHRTLARLRAAIAYAMLSDDQRAALHRARRRAESVRCRDHGDGAVARWWRWIQRLWWW